MQGYQRSYHVAHINSFHRVSMHFTYHCFFSFLEYSRLPWYRRSINWICGIDQQLQESEEISEEELKAMAAAQIDIYEEPFWRRFTAAQAITLMFLASFLCGFFAYSEFIVPVEYPYPT